MKCILYVNLYIFIIYCHGIIMISNLCIYLCSRYCHLKQRPLLKRSLEATESLQRRGIQTTTPGRMLRQCLWRSRRPTRSFYGGTNPIDSNSCPCPRGAWPGQLHGQRDLGLLTALFVFFFNQHFILFIDQKSRASTETCSVLTLSLDKKQKHASICQTAN